MSKKEIRRINTVPDWIRETVSGFSVTSEFQTHNIRNPRTDNENDLISMEVTIERLQEPGNGPKAKVLVKQVKSHADSGMGIDYVKHFDNPLEAEETYRKFNEELKKLAENKGDGDQQHLKDQGLRFFEKLETESDDTDPNRAEVGPKNLSKVAEGLDIVEKQGAYKVLVSDTLLTQALKKYKQVNGEPLQQPEITYTTSSRPHCGAHNFIVSYWGKLNTSDGNIVRKAVLVDRDGNGTRFLVAGVSKDEYDKLCEFLTPDPSHYGISYDSITGNYSLNKEALKVNMMTIIPETAEEKAEVMEMVKGEKPASDLADKAEGAEEEESTGELTGESGEETVPFEGGAEQSAPIAEGAEGGEPTGGFPDLSSIV